MGSKKNSKPAIMFFNRHNPTPGRPTKRAIQSTAKEVGVASEHHQPPSEADVPISENECRELLTKQISGHEVITKEENTMAEEKNGGKAKREWPKYPNPKADGEALGWDWKKKEDIPKQRLELALEALKNSFGNDAGLSGTSLRKLSEDKRKALDTFKESFLVPEKPGQQIKHQTDCWQAIQMASQEIFLQENKVDTEKIAYQHRWRLAVLPNDDNKLAKINQYIEADKVKETGYPNDKYVADLMGEQKDKSVVVGKTTTLPEVINRLKAHDLTVINSITPGELFDMVRINPNAEDVVELINIIDKIQQELTVYSELINVARGKKE